MLKEIIDRKKFLKKFLKSFTSFCGNAPIDISFSLGEKEVTFFVKGIEGHYDFDFLKNVHENIYQLKEKLLPYYPKLKTETYQYVAFTPEEIRQIMSEYHLSFDEAFSRKKKITISHEFLIEKILIEKNSYVIFDMKSKERSLLEMRTPILIVNEKISSLSSKEKYQVIMENKKREIQL